jgi:DNA-binding transcriptional LysR family regulator
MKPSIRNVDFNLLLLFEAIYRARNLTVAGQMVGISPSAASHALARLRNTFNDPLFVRLPRGLEPTPLADEMAGQTTAALDAVRAVFNRSEFAPESVQRTFRIAMNDVAERLMLPALSRHLQQQAPGVSLQTSAPLVRAIQQNLENGDIDMAFGSMPHIRGEIRQQLLNSTPYACVARGGHPDIRGSLSREQYLTASHVVAFPAGAVHGENIEHALAEANFRGRIAIRVRHFLAIPGIVNSTDLIATIPRALADSFRAGADIQVFEPPIEVPPYEVRLYWHERYHLEPGNKWLRSLIATTFQPQAAPAAARQRVPAPLAFPEGSVR